jgi:hypothetical protein
MKKCGLFLILFFCSLLLIGQDISLPILVTGRPGRSESASTLAKNSFQIEMGIMREHKDNEEFDKNAVGFATTLLRYGVWDNFELRLESFYGSTHSNDKINDTDTIYNGFGPLTAGFKVHVVEESGIRPEISILSSITLRHIGNENYAPVFSYPRSLAAFSHTLSNKFDLGYNAGFAYNGYSADGFFIYSMILYYHISKVVSCFGEFYGNFDHGNLPRFRIDGGFTFDLRKNLILDISAGYGFDRDINQNHLSFGYIWRINN